MNEFRKGLNLIESYINRELKEGPNFNYQIRELESELKSGELTDDEEKKIRLQLNDLKSRSKASYMGSSHDVNEDYDTTPVGKVVVNPNDNTGTSDAQTAAMAKKPSTGAINDPSAVNQQNVQEDQDDVLDFINRNINLKNFVVKGASIRGTTFEKTFPNMELFKDWYGRYKNNLVIHDINGGSVKLDIDEGFLDDNRDNVQKEYDRKKYSAMKAIEELCEIADNDEFSSEPHFVEFIDFLIRKLHNAKAKI